jgi:hypothetical protein
LALHKTLSFFGSTVGTTCIPTFKCRGTLAALRREIVEKSSVTLKSQTEFENVPYALTHFDNRTQKSFNSGFSTREVSDSDYRTHLSKISR